MTDHMTENAQTAHSVSCERWRSKADWRECICSKADPTFSPGKPTANE